MASPQTLVTDVGPWGRPQILNGCATYVNVRGNGATGVRVMGPTALHRAVDTKTLASTVLGRDKAPSNELTTDRLRKRRRSLLLRTWVTVANAGGDAPCERGWALEPSVMREREGENRTSDRVFRKDGGFPGGEMRKLVMRLVCPGASSSRPVKTSPEAPACGLALGTRRRKPHGGSAKLPLRLRNRRGLPFKILFRSTLGARGAPRGYTAGMQLSQATSVWADV